MNDNDLLLPFFILLFGNINIEENSWETKLLFSHFSIFFASSIWNFYSIYPWRCPGGQWICQSYKQLQTTYFSNFHFFYTANSVGFCTNFCVGFCCLVSRAVYPTKYYQILRKVLRCVAFFIFWGKNFMNR